MGESRHADAFLDGLRADLFTASIDYLGLGAMTSVQIAKPWSVHAGAYYGRVGATGQFDFENIPSAVIPGLVDKIVPDQGSLVPTINGDIVSVSAMTETFVKERKHNLTGKVEKVGIDDACLFHCHFNNGSLGLFESTRYARGHKALYTFEINGENMSLKWDLHDLHRLQIFDYTDTGAERMVADPATLLATDDSDLPAAERLRREQL